jgi:hypothetical protein
MGCLRAKSEDGSLAFICGPFTEDLTYCDCGRIVDALCDFPLPEVGRRCDAPLCSTCSHKPPGTTGVDLCPVHADAGWPGLAP